MGERQKKDKGKGVARYVVTKIFRAADGKFRQPGDPDPERGTVMADYDTAAQLRAAGCIGGMVNAHGEAVKKMAGKKKTAKKKKAKKKKAA